MAIRDMGDSTDIHAVYPSNSNVARDNRNTDISSEPEVRQVKQVATAKVRKQGIFRRIGRSLIEDTIESARERTLSEIIIPGIKTLIFDTMTETLDMVLFGGASPSSGGYRRSGGYSRRGDRTSYSEYYEKKNRSGRGKSDREDYRAVPYDPDDIIVDTRGEARAALDELDFTIHKYGQASVADFYDIVGVSGDWTDNRYGWTSLRGASIKPVRDGFMIVLPRTQVLD